MYHKIRSLAGGLIVLSLVLSSLAILQSTNQESEPLLYINDDNDPEMQRQLAMKNFSSMPLAFTENQGQWDDQALLRANAGGATMWFTREGTYYQFTRRIPRTCEDMGAPQLAVGWPDRGRFDREPDSIETMAIKTSFVGANLNPKVVGEEMLEHKCNYFIGKDQVNWHTDVANYRVVCFKEIYPGIDLKYYGNGRQMEYDLVVSPGADPSQIHIEYQGANSISVNDLGELVVETDWVRVVEQKPNVFQAVDGRRRQIEGKYDLFSSSSFGFKLSEDYNPNLPLVIDPVTLTYSTYLGGDSQDWGYGITADGSGNVYVTGRTFSTDFPTQNPYQTDQTHWDAFVTKLNNTGNGLVYSTYLGGDSEDQARGIALDRSGNAYVTGYTTSDNFPTQNPYQTYPNDQTYNVFATKLNSAGNGLVYSTYLGGSEQDYGYGIAVDGTDNAYVIGKTESSDFPTQNPYQTYQDWSDGFVTKLNSAGNGLVYSTYLGGDAYDVCWGIAVDGSGNAYATGFTGSSDFPTLNPFQTGPPQAAFVTKLNSAGNGLVYSTYLGGNGVDKGYGIAVDGNNNAYVTGQTSSTDFPTQGAYRTFQGAEDAFVTKLNSAGNGLVYSTYLGGGGQDHGLHVAVGGSGRAYVIGETNGSNFPTQVPYQTDQNSWDAFVTKLNSAGNVLVYSTYLGGNGADYGSGIAVDVSGNAYVTGSTESSDFPTQGPYQTDQYDFDVFVTKLSYACDCGTWGDVNADNEVNPVDAVLMVNFVYKNQDGRIQPPNCPYEAGDVNCDDAVNPVDMVRYVNYVYKNITPFPCDPCS